jgi:hypothetical protein
MKMSPRRGITLARTAALGAVAMMFVAGAQAQTSVTNNNSVITVNPASPNGMTAWSIGGNNILNQHSFYYRLGSGASSAISSLHLLSQSSTDKAITTTYENGSSPGASTFSLSVSYSLAGGLASSGVSDIAEQITISSLNNAVLTGFRFYQYASFIGANNVELSQSTRTGLFNDAYVYGPGLSVQESVDTGVVPGANEGEADANTLFNVQNGNTLNNSLTGTGGSWAFAWDENIGAGGSVIISKDLNAIVPVPEPSTWALFLVGVAIGGLHLYRRRAVKALAPVKA